MAFDRVALGWYNVHAGITCTEKWTASRSQACGPIWITWVWRFGWRNEDTAMPQLAKGGKWVFGWVLVGPHGEVTIPPEAWDEYGLQTQ